MNTNPHTHEVLDALARIVGSDNVLRANEEMAPYQEDWRGKFRGSALAVLRPGSTDEVSAVLRHCFEHRTPSCRRVETQGCRVAPPQTEVAAP